jgi:hypothetical protein
MVRHADGSSLAIFAYAMVKVWSWRGFIVFVIVSDPAEL